MKNPNPFSEGSSVYTPDEEPKLIDRHEFRKALWRLGMPKRLLK